MAAKSGRLEVSGCLRGISIWNGVQCTVWSVIDVLDSENACTGPIKISSLPTFGMGTPLYTNPFFLPLQLQGLVQRSCIFINSSSNLLEPPRTSHGLEQLLWSQLS